MNLYLIGYRATGKSTVGGMLGEMTGLSFYDTDSEIVKAGGMSIADIVSREGWDSFRKQERNVLRDLSFADRLIVSTGGGIVLNKSNVEDMRKTGLVVWLRANTETIVSRIKSDSGESRPSLVGGSVSIEDEVEETLLKRMSLYERSMDFFVDTDDLEPEEICAEILDRIKSRGVSL